MNTCQKYLTFPHKQLNWFVKMLRNKPRAIFLKNLSFVLYKLAKDVNKCFYTEWGEMKQTYRVCFHYETQLKCKYDKLLALYSFDVVFMQYWSFSSILIEDNELSIYWMHFPISTLNIYLLFWSFSYINRSKVNKWSF